MSEPATKDDILRLEKATRDDILRLDDTVLRLEKSTKDDILRLENSIKDLETSMKDLTRQNTERVIALLQDNLERLDSRQDSFLARFDNQSDRLDRQAGLLQTGRVWTVRTDSRIDKVESALEEKDRQIDAISERVRRLEERG
jgi:chromosome segregation ATPase